MCRGVFVSIVTYDADTIDIAEVTIWSFGCFDLNEVIESFASALFHRLEAEAHIHGKLKTEFVVSLQDVYPSEYGAFIIRGSPTYHLSGLGVYIKVERVRNSPPILVGL